MTISDKDLKQAVLEAEAQTTILKALRQVEASKRAEILRAVGLLLEADAIVPGVLTALIQGTKCGTTT